MTHRERYLRIAEMYLLYSENFCNSKRTKEFWGGMCWYVLLLSAAGEKI
jgi:hypothetical protein